MSTTTTIVKSATFKLVKHITTVYTFQDREIEKREYNILCHIHTAYQEVRYMMERLEGMLPDNTTLFPLLIKEINEVYDNLVTAGGDHKKLLNRMNAITQDHQHDYVRVQEIVEIVTTDYDETVETLLEPLCEKYPNIDFNCFYVMKSPSKTKSAAKGEYAPPSSST